MSLTAVTQGADASAPSIVVLISGSGTNLQAIIDACSAGKIPGKINAVVSNKADAYGLTRAEQDDINPHVLDHKAFDTRELYDTALIEVIDQYQPDVVVLAGFMRILTAGFVEHYKGKLIVNMGYSGDEAEQVIADGQADAVAFGVPFIANPDLPERLKQKAELNQADPTTFYSQTAEGYTDYPTLAEQQAEQAKTAEPA